MANSAPLLPSQLTLGDRLVNMMKGVCTLSPEVENGKIHLMPNQIEDVSIGIPK